MKKITLFCIPYAGGSATVYNKWKLQLPQNIQLCPIELAGRGQRIMNPLYNSIDEAAEDVFNIIKYQLNGLPYAFFGHSMGTVISYRLTQKLKERNFPLPRHLFFSGRGAPHIRRADKKPYHALPPDEFKEKVLDLGGTPPELFELPELMELVLPMLRNDFRITWSYQVRGNIEPLDSDMTILTGTDEDLNPDQLEDWKMHAANQIKYYQFPGGHFYLHKPENQTEILKIIANVLSNQ